MKEYAYYRNGTIHSTVFAKSKKEAKKQFDSVFGKDCEVHLHYTEKELIIDKVVDQIEDDLLSGDTTSLIELLKYIPKKNLQAFLSEKL